MKRLETPKILDLIKNHKNSEEIDYLGKKCLIENLKIAAKIRGKTAIKWIFIFLTGNLVTLITFIIALYGNIELAGERHGSVIGLFLGLLMKNFFAFLLVFGALGFLVLYFIVANKTSVQYAIYLLWKGKTGDYISSKVGDSKKNNGKGRVEKRTF